MDEDKSREYRELVAKVKLKYRENPICKGNLRLGWCDLVPGEDLCQEINLWTYWQEFGYARETPHIKSGYFSDCKWIMEVKSDD